VPFNGATAVSPPPPSGQAFAFAPNTGTGVQGFASNITVSPTTVIPALTFGVNPGGGSGGSIRLAMGLAPVAGPNTPTMIMYGLQFNIVPPASNPAPGVFAIRNGAPDSTAQTTAISTATLSMTNSVLTCVVPGVSTPIQIKVTPSQNALYYIAVIVQYVSPANTLTVSVTL
jgi:hypothetical protein